MTTNANAVPFSDKPTVRPEDVGFSAERLARIPAFLQSRYLDTGKIPCALTMIRRRGEIAHVSVQGKADVERDRKLEFDALFRIYSMTKPITSIAFMMLVEEGRVSLDEPVHRHIPDWRNLGVYAGGSLGAFQTKPTAGPMRMIDLLRHTSGLTYGFQMRTEVDAAYRARKIGDFATAGGLEEMMAQIADTPLEFSPGEAWNYSVSTDVLGYLVEKISGVKFGDFLKQRIFQPLGMTDTDFHAPESEWKRLPACYARLPSGRTILQDDPEKSPYRQPPPLQSGGGGLVSTASDYMKFCAMLANRGELNGARMIGAKTLQLMTMNHLPGGKELIECSQSLYSEAVFAGLGFGLGFSMTTDLARTQNLGSKGEYFWGGMASTAFWIDPVEDLSVVFLTQLMPSHSYPIRRELRTLIYSAMTDANSH